MLDRITRAGIASRLAIAGFVSNLAEKAKDDRGQGSVEYIGIIVAVVAIVVAVATFGEDIGKTIGAKIQEVVSSI